MYDIKKIAEHVHSNSMHGKPYSIAATKIGLRNVKKAKKEEMYEHVYNNIKRYFSQWADSMNVELANLVVEGVHKEN